VNTTNVIHHARRHAQEPSDIPETNHDKPDRVWLTGLLQTIPKLKTGKEGQTANGIIDGGLGLVKFASPSITCGTGG